MEDQTTKVEEVVDTKKEMIVNAEEDAKFKLNQAIRQREHDAAVEIDAVCKKFNVGLQAKFICDSTNGVQLPITVVALKQ